MTEIEFLDAMEQSLLSQLEVVRNRKAEASKLATAPREALRPAVLPSQNAGLQPVPQVQPTTMADSVPASPYEVDVPPVPASAITPGRIAPPSDVDTFVAVSAFADEPSEPSDFTQLHQCLAAWPSATPADRVAPADDVGSRINRGEGIVSILVKEDLQGRSFLDFGCGDGAAAAAAAVRAQTVVGYDPQQHEMWPQLLTDTPNMTLTQDLGGVTMQAPYDVILLHDVLDHASDPVDVLKTVKQLGRPGTRVIVRCHPWCSRHGGHHYRELNKAFIHLVFTDAELERLGVTPPDNPPTRLLHPLSAYAAWFAAADLSPSEPDITGNRVEAFFKDTPIVVARLRRHWSVFSQKPETATPDFSPTFQMEQSFVDYEIVLP